MNMILTNRGEELASNGFLTGIFPKITKVMFGDGNGVMVTPNKAMTALVHSIQEGVGTTIVKMGNPNRLSIYTQIPQSVGGITIREVGLFNDANELIAIGGNFEKIKPLISESVEKFDFYITVPLSSAQDITVQFSNDNIYADQNAVDLVTNAIETRRLENINMDNRIVDIETNRISIPTAYNIYNGKVTLDNTVVNVGVGTYAYTGNTTVLPTIPLGMDIESQWGNDVSEKYGYLIQIRTKDSIGEWYWVDSVRGNTKYVSSSNTAVEGTDAAMFTLSTVGGVTTINIGTSTKTNTNAVTYILYVYQTTHRKTWTTNHNITETEHYNPYSGVTVVGYAGSSKVEHQLSHSLGKKLDIVHIKDLTFAGQWMTYTSLTGSGYINLNNGLLGTTKIDSTDTTKSVSNYATRDYSDNYMNDQYVMYGFRNSYFDDDNILQGIFEIGLYTGGPLNNHNIVPTRARPGIIDLKRVNTTGNWYRWDVVRPNNKALPLNSNVAPVTYTYGINGYNSFKLTQSDAETNATGETYLYFTVYDNDNLSGKSKYKKSTDTSNITLNALVPYADGIDTLGSKVSITYKNETISGLTLTNGKNRVYSKKDGTYGVSKYDPMMVVIRDRLSVDENPDFFDLKTHKWYSVIPAIELISNNKFDSNTNGWTAYSGATLASSNGVMTIVGGTNGIQGYTTINVVAGVRYKFKYSIQLQTSTGSRIILGNAIGDSSILYFMSKSGANDNQTGKYEYEFTAPYTGIVYVSLLNNSTIGTTWLIDDISIFDIVPVINTLITSRNYLNCIVYADQNGQPTYIEEIDKETYFNKIVADIVNAGGLDLTFLNQLTGNGYQKLPGGLIFQWGTANAASSYTGSNLFPIKFPNSVIGVVFGAAIYQSSFYYTALTVTGFNWDRVVATTAFATYIAIGY